MEPQYNEGPRDGQNLFAITRFRYIEVDFHIFCYYWSKENLSLYRYIYCNLSEKAMNDQTKKIYIILLITFHHSTIEKMIAKTLDLVSLTLSRLKGINNT